MKEEEEKEGDREGEHALINWINNDPLHVIILPCEKMNMKFKVHVMMVTSSDCFDRNACFPHFTSFGATHSFIPCIIKVQITQ